MFYLIQREAGIGHIPKSVEERRELQTHHIYFSFQFKFYF
jgi:hypothetical protein